METVWSRTAEVLRKYGWRKGVYGNIDAGMCLVGGLTFAEGYRIKVSGFLGDEIDYAPQPTYLDAEKGKAIFPVILDHLGIQDDGDQGISRVIRWNDENSTTEDDVLGLLGELHEKELAERGELA